MTIRVQEQDFDVGQELARLTEGNHAIGGLAVFLCSPAADQMTGAPISSDGGWTAQ